MKIGDKVSVIDENLGGIITSVHQSEVVFRDEYGFTHRYHQSKIVLQNPELYQNISTVQKIETQKQVSKKHNKKHMVLDLHFESLVDQPSQYASLERIFIQKEKLIETIEFCKTHRLKKLEIIHGIGDGVLQKMVKEVLISQTGLDFYDLGILKEQSGSVMVEFH